MAEQNPFLAGGAVDPAPDVATANPFLTGGGSTGGYHPAPPSEDDSGLGGGLIKAGIGLTAGAAGLAGLAKIAGNGKIGTALKTANAVRQQLMLSGMALPKSVLGNIGSGVESLVEGKGLNALREILSGETVRDAMHSFNTGRSAVAPGTGHAVELPKIMSLPGRLLGAFDDATQAALRRAGTTAEEAQAAVLQRPLGGRLGKLEGPAAQYIHPFRRTPFNQWLEGLDKFDKAAKGDRGAIRGLAGYGTAGAIHGAATADDNQPYSIPIAIAASARYGLPYGVAALAGRALAGGRLPASGIAGAVLPVSEYGLETASDPRKILNTFKPAAFTAIERMTK